MPPKPNPLKKIIIILTILVIAVGAFFGVKFYQSSINQNNDPVVTDPKTGQTRLQVRTSTSSEPDPQIGLLPNATSVPNTINIPTIPTKPRLTHLWKEPVSGFDFVYKDIEITSTTTVDKPVALPAPKPVAVSTTTSASSSTTTKKIFSIDEKKTPIQTPTPPPAEPKPIATTTPTIVYKKTIIKDQEFIYLWDRATGHIYENLSSTTGILRFSNYTLPRIEEALFTDAFSVLVREVGINNETIVTKNLTFFKEVATTTLYTANIKNIFLPAKQISLLTDSKKIFYFSPKTGKGMIMNTDGTSPTMIINTSLTEWLYQYVNKNTVSVTTKPSAYFPGYLFFVTTTGSGNNDYILGDKYGLTTLTSPDATKVLYNEIINDQLETFIFDVKSKSSIKLSQATLSDKCVWERSSKLLYCGIPQILSEAPYPDAWYQNKTRFADNIWSINPETGEFNIVVPLQDQVSKPIDIYNIKISKTNKHLLFQDRYSLTLWKYEL